MTAQRRTERLQDVPIAVTVVTGDALNQNNFNGLNNLVEISPAVTYNPGGAAFQIRGVGTQSQNGSIEQDVAVVIDDVVQGVTEIDMGFPYYDAVNDVDRIEVLEGPQGTLFGKNSSAGVLNITTKRPVMGLYEDDASISYGSRNEVKLSDTLNIPLGDNLAFRASGFSNRQDGIGYNEYTKGHVDNYLQQGLKLKLLWKPNNNFTGYLMWEDSRSHTNYDSAGALRTCGTPATVVGSFCNIDEANGVVPSKTNVTLDDDNANQSKTHKSGPTLRLDYSGLPFGLTFTSISAYFRVSELASEDEDETPTPFLSHFYEPFHADEITQEFRLSSPSNQFIEYTVGAFYYHTTADQDVQLAGTLGATYPGAPTLLLGVFGAGQTITRNFDQSFAGYGQATMHVNDHLRLIGGLRVTHDEAGAEQAFYAEKNVCSENYAFDPGSPCIPTTYSGTPQTGLIPGNTPFSYPTIPSTGKINATNLSGKVGVQYDVNRNLMGYFTFATGYKGPAPAFFPTEYIGSVWTPIKPETDIDYEAGIKSQWLDRRVTFNANIFYTKYTNFQANYYLFDAGNPSLSQFVTGNAGALETKGVESQVSFAATPELTFSGSVAYLPTKYISFAIACNPYTGATNPATPGGPTQAPCYAAAGSPPGSPFTLFNAAGYPLTHSPDINYNLTADYRHSFGNGMVGSVHVNWNWRSQQYYSTADPNTIEPGYGLLDASIAYGAENGKWRVSVFARNLLDQFYLVNIQPTLFDGGIGPNPTGGYSQVFDNDARRTVGVKLEAKFN